MTVKGYRGQAMRLAVVSFPEFFILTRPLRLGLRRHFAVQRQPHIAGESADRQPVEKHMGGAVLIDPPAADLKPAPEFLTDALHRESGMCVQFIVVRHNIAVAELET
jgi:hypothetical protein